jgi:hypothetical protein
MRFLKWLLSALAPLSLCFGATSAFACSCMQTDAEAALRWPVVVFSGLAIAAELKEGEEGRHVVTRFTPETVWKGSVPEKVEVVTPVDSAACGWSFQVGIPHIVAARRAPDGSHFTTNICTMMPFADAENGEQLVAMLRDYAARREALEQATTQKPDDLQAWLDKAAFLKDYGEWPEAAEAYKRVLASQEANLQAWVGLGEVYFGLEDYEAALTNFERALAISPNEERAVQGRKDTLERLGRSG